MESCQEGKDFFQPLPLDPGDPEQVPGVAKPSEPGPLGRHRLGGRVGDAGKVRQFPQARAIDIDPVSQKIFLPDPDGSPSGAVDGAGKIPARVAGGPESAPKFRRQVRRSGAMRVDTRSDQIPDQDDQG